jgi:NADH:ubiquinone oxidoreductase subunit
MFLNIIFTWWNKQTLGTFLKTLFYGIYVGKDDFGNKYYKSKKNERWVIYSNNIEATKITSEWYLWMHHTIDTIPGNKEMKYLWQKEHLENQSGTKNSYKPTKIKKYDIKKKYESWK